MCFGIELEKDFYTSLVLVNIFGVEILFLLVKIYISGICVFVCGGN